MSRQLVTYLQRPGNQAQISMFTAPRAIRHSLVQDGVSPTHYRATQSRTGMRTAVVADDA